VDGQRRVSPSGMHTPSLAFKVVSSVEWTSPRDMATGTSDRKFGMPTKVMRSQWMSGSRVQEVYRW
jgi:hypothetical protein